MCRSHCTGTQTTMSDGFEGHLRDGFEVTMASNWRRLQREGGLDGIDSLDETEGVEGDGVEAYCVYVCL